jgi:hypothetical protein
MGRKKLANITDFYRRYVVDKANDLALAIEFDLKHDTLIKYKTEANKLIPKEITTEFLRNELLKQYIIETDTKAKAKLMDQMMDLWKFQHKIPEKEVSILEKPLQAQALE